MEGKDEKIEFKVIETIAPSEISKLTNGIVKTEREYYGGGMAVHHSVKDGSYGNAKRMADALNNTKNGRVYAVILEKGGRVHTRNDKEFYRNTPD